MKLLILKTVIALVLLAFALNYMPQANAQEASPEGELQVDEQTQATQQPSAITDALQDDEVPPPPEAPYPGAAEEGFAQEEIEAPSDSAAPMNQTSKLEQPIDKKKDGTWYYGVKESDKSFAASFRGGMFGAPEIRNPRNGFFFSQIYEQQEIPTIFFDFEWQLKTFIGAFAAKLGTGIFYVQGEGKFADSARKFDVPPEEFTFLMLPNTVSAIYRLRFHEKQPIIPYAEAGAGYFTFMELRGDGDIKFNAAPITFLSLGASFLLDWLDPKAVRDLDREYGVNHVYLTAEYREILGLNETYDFTSRVISGGIMMEF